MLQYSLLLIKKEITVSMLVNVILYLGTDIYKGPEECSKQLIYWS